MTRRQAALAALAASVACGAEAATAIPVRAPEVAQALHDGLAAFARRAEGTTGVVGNCVPVDLALDHLRRARAAAPDDLEVVAALLRALQFRGSFCAASREEKKQLFEQGRQLGQAALDRLEARAGKDPQRRLEHLRREPHAGLVHVWTAALWGEWAAVSGKLAAVRSGVAGRLRDLAQTVIDIDPGLEQGAGQRLLGRLHADAPRLPFLTGWVSREKGLALLRESHALGPDHPVTRVFLAEAILAHEPQRRAEAIALLEAVIASPPRPDLVVEDRSFAARARVRLALVRP